MKRSVGWSAAVGLLIGVWAFRPQPEATQERLSNNDDVADAPLPLAPDSSPSLVELSVQVHPHDQVGRYALGQAFNHVGGGPHPLWMVDDLSEGTVGLPWLINRSDPFHWAPSRQIRDTLTLAGLRPAAVGGWLAEVWPRAAVAGVIAEERWHAAERPDNHIRSSQAVFALASELATDPDPWVDRVASTYVLRHAALEERERWALDLLATDPDPLMQDIAVEYLSIGRLPLEADAEALLWRMARERPEHAAQLGVYGIRAALSGGDVERAASFLPMIEDGARHLQEEWLVEAIDRGLHKFRGQLAARGRAEVTSWQSGLVVVAHDCAASESTHREVHGTGVYDGAWRWHWASDDALTRCLTSTEAPGPQPPRGQRVDLEIAVYP